MSEQLFIQWLPIFLLAVAAVLFVVGNVLVSKFLGEDRPTFSKLSPYESGNEPEGRSTRHVSVHYSLVAVLFILFDIEIIFMYPWAMSIDRVTWPSMYAMLVFILILAFGYFYAWQQGVFEWK